MASSFATTTAATTLASPNKSKGKQRDHVDISSGPDSDPDPSSNSDDGSESDIDVEDITPEYLESLLEKSRQNARAAQKPVASIESEEEVLILAEEKDHAPFPPLNPGTLPKPYLTLADKHHERPLMLNDPEVVRAEVVASKLSAPAPPVPPPELTASGKPLTKKERKALKKQTAGPGWFDLPAPAESDLPHLYREVEALRLRNQLDPKRFYRKDEGEGKGIKGLPKYFAMGTILPTETPFGTPSTDNLPKSHRKRTLVDDAEAKRYAKKKFNELQTVRGAKGRSTLAAKKAARRQKW